MRSFRKPLMGLAVLFTSVSLLTGCGEGKLSETEKIVRNVVKNIGYEQDGFHYKNINIDNFIHSQSQDIARGVVEQDDKPAGAGDQGIMFGYATDEAEGTEFMPAPMFYANAILRNLAEARHQGVFPELRPDAKAQVTMLYENGIPVKADSIVVSTQHTPETSTEEVREIVRYIVKPYRNNGSALMKSFWSILPAALLSADRTEIPV